MISRLLSFLCLIILSTSAAAQPMVNYFLSDQNDISRGNKFSSIEEQSEILIKGINSAPHKVVKKFNSHGQISSSVTYNSAGGVVTECSWEYLNGTLLTKRSRRYFTNMRGWNDDELIIERDANTLRPTKVEVFRLGKIWQWAVILYDTLGRLESARVFSNTGAHIFTERAMYLEATNTIRVAVYKSNGIFVSNSTYPIDASKPFSTETVSRQFYPNGDLMTETLTDAIKGDQAYFYEYDYDSQGNWIEKRTYQAVLGRNNKVTKKKVENRVTRKITYL